MTDYKSIVNRAISRGMIRPPTPGGGDADSKRREEARVYMQRLRAERRGQDTSKFPPRVRIKMNPPPVPRHEHDCN